MLAYGKTRLSTHWEGAVPREKNQPNKQETSYKNFLGCSDKQSEPDSVLTLSFMLYQVSSGTNLVFRILFQRQYFLVQIYYLLHVCLSVNSNTKGSCKKLFLLDLSTGQRTPTHFQYFIFIFKLTFSAQRSSCCPMTSPASMSWRKKFYFWEFLNL